MSNIPDREEIVALAKKLATPIDFASLEKEVIIRRKGVWFEITNPKDMPEHALRQIQSFQVDSKGNYFVRFPRSWRRAQRVYQRMSED